MKEPVFLHDDEYYYEITRSNIKKYRLENNLTQQDLADLTGLSRQYICDIENKNRNKHITIAVLARIADALNLNIIEFFIEDEELKVTIKSVLQSLEKEQETINV